MRKKIAMPFMAAALTASMAITSYAGWEQSGTQWKYKNNDGTYASNGWQWIDGNNDGISECYYFGADGNMLASAITPDGYSVNADGAWVENGVVQTKGAYVQSNTTEETYQVADASDNVWSFGGSSGNGNSNNISSTGTAGTGYKGLKLLTDEEAYQKILEVKREHPTNSASGSCASMVAWVNGALYGNEHIYLPSKDFDWDDLHVGDAVGYSDDYTSGHWVIVMEIHDDYLLVAESGSGNYVKYGVKITRDHLENECYSLGILSAWQ